GRQPARRAGAVRLDAGGPARARAVPGPPAADPASRRMTGYSVVVPTVGRLSLARLLAALASGRGPRAAEIVVVDDRRAPTGPLPGLSGPVAGPAGVRLRVLRGEGRGPAPAPPVRPPATSPPPAAFLAPHALP